MRYILSVILSILLVFPLWSSAYAADEVLERQIVSRTDDAYEDADEDDEVDAYDEKVRVDGDSTIGLRFTNITIPNGVLIKEAYLYLQAEESDGDDCHVTIFGEDSKSPGAFRDESERGITRRTKTTASVKWEINNNAYIQEGVVYQSVDIRTIIKEIVDRADWVTGDPLVLIIETENYEKHDFNSYDSNQTVPKLVITYQVSDPPPPIITVTPAVSIGAETVFGSNAASKSFTLTNIGGSTLNFTVTEAADWFSLSPTIGTLAVGASIPITLTYTTAALAVGNHDATITITADDGTVYPYDYMARVSIIPQLLTGHICGDVPVYTENLVNPAVLLLMDVSGSMDWQAPLVSAEDNIQQTHNLSTIVQEIVDRPGWLSGSAMTFIIAGSGDREAVAHDASGDQAPLLHIEYVDGGMDVFSVDARVDQDSDDAEERMSNGSVTRQSNDLNFGERIVGLRFRNLDIPPGVTIQNAHIELFISEKEDTATDLNITGEAADSSVTFTNGTNDITARTTTMATVAWSGLPAWDPEPTEKRIKIGQDVLSELILDRSISWGFGTWSTRKASADNYTDIDVGTKPYSLAHEQALLDAIDAASPDGATPLTPSLLAAKDYFAGNRIDQEYSEAYYDPGCQPKMVIEITDGIGNTGTTVANVGTTTKELTDAGISVVGVGFSIDDAVQLDTLAQVSNEQGAVDEEDDVYALHDVDANGDGTPFLAYSKSELIEVLGNITSSLKSQVFYGSAPAATTSVDNGNVVISAKFIPDDWSGDLVAIEYNADGSLGAERWSAQEVMPAGADINAFTWDSADPDHVVDYATSGLHPFYLCKPLGDIINSTPKIVGDPAFHYSFDNYEAFKDLNRGRDELVYVGANDGALHAFDLLTGIEQWRFYPQSMQSELNPLLVGTNEDLCGLSEAYCHKYFVDGSPVAADVYDGSDWSTILVTGLGKGGSAYFTLDVTGGKVFKSGTGEVKYLWEFTDPELGLATGEPAIGQVYGPEWGVYFGSGSSVSAQATKEAYLFGVKAIDGSPLWQDITNNPIDSIKLSATLLQDDALSSPLLVDIGIDDIEEHLYTGNLYGSMYRVANIGDGQTPQVSELFSTGRSGHANAISAKAAYAYDETDENVWIYFGTGKYEEMSDKTTMDQQYFMGLKDNDAARLAAVSTNKATYFWDAASDQVGTPSDPIKELAVQRVTVAGIDYRIVESCDDSSSSWLMKLLADFGMTGSERVTAKPLVIGGIVYFATFIPDTNVCAGNGDAWLYALDYKTGCPASAFDINGDGDYDDGDSIMIDGVKYVVAGIKIGEGESSDLESDGETLTNVTTTGGVTMRKLKPQDLSAKLRTWRAL